MILILSKKGSNYFTLQNTNGKKWMFDIKYMKIGLCLYQPSSPKGRLVKIILGTNLTRFLIRSFNMTKKYSLNIELDKILQHVYKNSSLNYSFFFGTPGVHSKMVIQVSSDTRMLGYAKLSTKNEILELFKNEYNLLSNLKSVGIDNIPTPLCIEQLGEYYVYCQTTTKTNKSKSPEKYDDLTNSFLVDLNKRTSKRIRYEKSSLYSNLHNVFFYDGVKDIEEQYDKYLKVFDSFFMGSVMDSVVSHRDFTPWNMFIESEKLFVFDWEYSSDGYLPMMDMFHFVIQQQIMDTGASFENLVNYIENNWHIYTEYIAKETIISPLVILFAYLMDFVSLYISRAQHISSSERESITIRLKLLSYLQNKMIS